MSIEEFILNAKDFIPENTSAKILPLIKEKIDKFSDIKILLDGELSFVNSIADYSKESLMWKEEKDLVNTKQYLKDIIEILISLDDFSKEAIKSALWPMALAKGKGSILWPMRYALSGKDKSPDPFIISEILEKEETIRRLKIAYEKI